METGNRFPRLFKYHYTLAMRAKSSQSQSEHLAVLQQFGLLCPACCPMAPRKGKGVENSPQKLLFALSFMFNIPSV